MGRIVQSPAKCWPGSVTISDPLTVPQYIQWQDAVEAVRSIGDEKLSNPRVLLAILPGICACVEKWELRGKFPEVVTPDTFPQTPRAAALKLSKALVDAITEIAYASDEVPNE